MERNQRANPQNNINSSIKKPFIEHIHELRKRLFIWFVLFIAASIIGFNYYKILLDLLLKPLNKPLYYSSPLGGLNFIFQISILFGLIVSLPLLVYEIIRFIEPVFPKTSKKIIFLVPLSSTILAIIGVCFAYFISLPAALGFFGSFGGGELHPLISTNEYFSFVIHYLVGIAVLFQLPVFLFITNLIYPLSKKLLLKYQRHFIVISFVVAAVFTLDPINQTLMAIPLIILYYLSIIIILLFNRHKIVI